MDVDHLTLTFASSDGARQGNIAAVWWQAPGLCNKHTGAMDEFADEMLCRASFIIQNF